MPDGKSTVSKPPEPKSPAALGKTTKDSEDINRRSLKFYDITKKLIYKEINVG